jgi:DNA-binding response OmpR family regulator
MSDVHAENVRLRERVRELESLAGLDLLEPMCCTRVTLTRKQARLLGLLLKNVGRLTTREVIFDYIYGHLKECEQPTPPAVDQILHQLRGALGEHGIEITNEVGLGWYLTADAIKAVIELTGTLWIKQWTK